MRQADIMTLVREGFNVSELQAAMCVTRDIAFYHHAIAWSMVKQADQRRMTGHRSGADNRKRAYDREYQRKKRLAGSQSGVR